MEAMLVSLLAPALPYLLGKAEGAADKAIDRFGEEAWKLVRTVWTRLRPKVESKDSAREAAAAVADNPGDETARGALQFQLRALLQADSDLATELERALRDGQRAGVVADNGAVVVQGDVRADRGGIAAGRDIQGGPGGIHTSWSGEQERREPER